MINEQIRDKEVRLVSETGEQLGIVSVRAAQALASERNLDLVKIAPTAKPPVCKIMDYSKFRFEQIKKEKEARKKQKTVDIKEIRLSPNIDTNDVLVKARKAAEFLREGDKVKVSVRFRYGRELARVGAVDAMMRKFAADLSDLGVIEKPPKLETKTLAMFITPKPSSDVKTT
jgi:translation initiation factor IF-3